MATSQTETTTTLVDKKWKTFTFISLGLFVIALGLMIYFIISQNKAKTQLSNTESRLEQYRSENSRLNAEVTNLSTSKGELEQSLSVANDNLSAKQIVITRLNQENRTLGTIKGQIVEMEKATQGIDANNAKLQTIQKEMRNTIAAREKQNKEFENQIK